MNILYKRIVSIILICIVSHICFASSVLAENFADRLAKIGIDVQTITKQLGISRYELTRLLNAVECKDCIVPDRPMIDRYTSSFWNSFIVQPGKDFWDIVRWQARYQEQSYYYCVARVWDISYMRGYPEETSIICAGDFCGARNVTKAELLQVVINVLAQYIYTQYSLSRSQVSQRYNTLPDWYTKRIFNQSDIDIIQSAAMNCRSGSCSLSNPQQFQVYLKYCMFNLKACGMNSYVQTPEAFWPVAELNVLTQLDIISQQYADQWNTNRPVRWDEVISLFGRLHDKIACSFDNDYDCDGVDNYKDNCPNTYNPKQRDTDRDLIGDVCDDDIDNDTIRNPIGIVDANWLVLVWLLTPETDNCLFVPNVDQRSTIKKLVWDACSNSSDAQVWLSIVSRSLTMNQLIFQAQTVGPWWSVQRDLWDGMILEWERITYTYTRPWLYIVSARSVWPVNTAVATTTIYIPDQWEDRKIGASLSMIIASWSRSPFVLRLDSQATGLSNIQYQWKIWEKSPVIWWSQYNAMIEQWWDYPIRLMIMQWWISRAVALGTVVVAPTYTRAAWLQSSSFVSQINTQTTLRTVLIGIDDREISEIRRDLWEWAPQKSIKNTNLTLNIVYSTPWLKLINQRIVLRDGTVLYTQISVSIVPTLSILPVSTISLVPRNLLLPQSSVFVFGVRQDRIDVEKALVMIQRPDTQTSTLINGDKIDASNNSFSHRYNDIGIAQPRVTTILPQCKIYESSATIVVSSINQCMDARSRWLLDQYNCDMDDDKIPDICDDDIDGDWVKNLLWLIVREPTNCAYTFNDINPSVLKEHFWWSCRLDNCPLIINTNQQDINRDGKGDVCQDSVTMWWVDDINKKNIIDSDGDGIPDSVDRCPLISETYNGVQDTDGCPEFGSDDACIISPKSVIKPQCMQCPCPIADTDGDLKPGDLVRSILVDPGKSLLQVVSTSRVIE